MNKQQLEAMINWDEIPEEYCCLALSYTPLEREFKGMLVNIELLESVPDGNHHNLIKRPIKLIDGAWYAFSYDNPSTEDEPIEMIGEYFESNCEIICSCVCYKPDKPGVIIHKQIPCDFWESGR